MEPLTIDRELFEYDHGLDESEFFDGTESDDSELENDEIAVTDDLEWSEDELQYSIIVSPTSPGDDRFRIPARTKKPSTLFFPFNTICLLERHSLKGGVTRVTGTLIAPQVVLTARHCLTTPTGGKRFSKIVVSPGADLSAANAKHRRPAGPSSINATHSRFRVDSKLDYGVILLPKPFKTPSRFMMLQPRSDAGTATLLTIAGYPCDKPRGTMWGHSGKIPLTSVSTTHLRYTIDTCPGHSGSPIWLLGNNSIRLLLGIHTSGPAGCDNDPEGTRCLPTAAPVTPVPGQNRGVRVTCNVINNILKWCKEFGVRGPAIDNAAYQRRCK
ncbi:MAG: trypsin-like serine protease [Candidatus Binatia bacterium]